MRATSFLTVVCTGFAVLFAGAEEGERETFGKWRIGVGAAFNSQVRSNVGMRNLPVPSAYSAPSYSTKDAALRRAAAHRYDGGGYIDNDDLDPASGLGTENWRLPVGSYRGNGHFELDNSYEEVIGGAVGFAHRDASDDRMQFGMSVEASRELWIHDEEDEHRWGVDFVAAFSYFFAREIYSDHAAVTRTDSVRDGKIRTDVVDPDAMYDYDQGFYSPLGGMYGNGNAVHTFNSPALGYDSIGDPRDIGGPSRPVVSSCGYNASGDYRELEMLFMFRPWYEITDWWRVYAEVGVGVSWGRFDATVSGMGDEDFSQWDCYGVTGLGTAFRYDDWTLGIDFLGRFLRDDLDVDGRYVSGSIERSDWGFRVMLGYEF